MDIQPISELANEKFYGVSDHSMSPEKLEDDDLLDDEEEYQKELEDQRIMDARNGHFEEGFLPPFLPTATPEQAAAYIAQSFNAASMSIDTYVGEGSGQSSEIPGMRVSVSSMDGGADAVSGIIAGAVMYQDVILGKEESQHGGARFNHVGMEEASLVKCTVANSLKQADMGSEQSLIKVADFTALSSTTNTTCFMEKLQLQHVSQHEENASLDLVEGRNLVEQQYNSGLQSGPPFLGQVSASLSTSPSNFFIPTPPISPQPNTQPIKLPNPNSSQPKNKHIKPKKAAHFSKIPTLLSRPRLPASASGDELAIKLFSSRQPPGHLKKQSSSHPQSSMLRPLQPDSNAGKHLAAALFAGQKHPSKSKILPPSHPQPISVLTSPNM